jgi:nucleoside-diphosphate-sugar epimerase
MKVLVTGGSGFIGTNLVKDLLAEGHSVQIYDKKKSARYPDISIVADVRDKEKLADAMQGVDAVCHLAAEHHDDVRPISLYYDVNVGSAENIVFGMEKHKINRLVFTSTVSVYGLDAGESHEESPIKPFNDYGKSKYQSEIILTDWAKTGADRDLFIVRPTVVFGEGNVGNVSVLLKQLRSRKFVMIGKGENKKSMSYVGNVSKFLTLLVENPPESGVNMYNYSDKPDLDMENLIHLVQGGYGRNHKSHFRLPYAVGLFGGYVFDFLALITRRSFPVSSIRIKKFCANTVINADKLQKTGFKPPYSLTEGIRNTVSYDTARSGHGVWCQNGRS